MNIQDLAKEIPHFDKIFNKIQNKRLFKYYYEYIVEAGYLAEIFSQYVDDNFENETFNIQIYIICFYHKFRSKYSSDFEYVKEFIEENHFQYEIRQKDWNILCNYWDFLRSFSKELNKNIEEKISLEQYDFSHDFDKSLELFESDLEEFEYIFYMTRPKHFKNRIKNVLNIKD